MLHTPETVPIAVYRPLNDRKVQPGESIDPEPSLPANRVETDHHHVEIGTDRVDRLGVLVELIPVHGHEIPGMDWHHEQAPGTSADLGRRQVNDRHSDRVDVQETLAAEVSLLVFAADEVTIG